MKGELIKKNYGKLEANIINLLLRDGAPKHALLSALGRLHLQLGNISGNNI